MSEPSTSPPEFSNWLPELHPPIEEFSFVDLALVLVRRWWILFVCLLVAWGWLANWISHARVQYESRAVIKIGRSRLSGSKRNALEERDRLIEPVEVLAIRLREEYSPQDPSGAYVSDVTFDKDADSLLTIYARAPQSKTAQQLLDVVAVAIISEHTALLEPQREVIQNRLTEVEQELKLVQEELRAIPARPVEPAASDPMQEFARASLLTQQISLGQEQFRLQRDLLELQVEPTRIVTPSQENQTPVEPRVRSQAILVTAAGLFLGCALSVVWEFCAQVRKRLQKGT